MTGRVRSVTLVGIIEPTKKRAAVMVKGRLRRSNFQRPSLGVGTPCQSRTPDLFFPAGERPWVDAAHPGAYDLARRLCARCESRRWCLAVALSQQESYGVWGGTTPAERAQILADRMVATARP